MDEYQEINNTYIATPIPDPKEKVEVEIGDVKKLDFYPQVKVKKWDNEVNYSHRLVHDEEDPTVSLEDNKIIWEGERKRVEFYNIAPNDEHEEGAYEMNIIEKVKHPTNKTQLTINTKGLEFFKLKSVTDDYELGQVVEWGDEIWTVGKITENEVFDTEGNLKSHSDINSIGGYVAYYKDCPLNIKGGRLYRDGCAGFITRPKIITAKGQEVWGTQDLVLNDDGETGILTITTPEEIWADETNYPLQIDPTFGFSGTALSENVSANAFSAYFVSNNETGTLTDLTFKVAKGTGNNLSAALYAEGSVSPTTLLAIQSSVNSIPSGNNFIDVPMNSYAIAANTGYWLTAKSDGTVGCWFNTVSNPPNYKYLLGGITYLSWPNPFSGGKSGGGQYRGICYATYTASGGFVQKLKGVSSAKGMSKFK